MISSENIKSIPHRTGVYLFKNKQGNIIYVGKSRDLQNRVKQYFVKSGDSRLQVVLIKRNTSSIDYFITKTEQEALLLEYNLIKKHQPRYNVRLKETNNYPYIMITEDDLPQLKYTWKKDEKGVYFGPFTSTYFVTSMVRILTDLFHLRKCNEKNPTKACLEHQMGNCDAPCENMKSREMYLKNIESVKQILQGHYSSMSKILYDKMIDESQQEHYERAALIRDTLKIVRGYMRRGKRTGVKHRNRDAVFIARNKSKGVFTLVKLRDGVIMDILEKRFSIPESIPDEMVLKDALLDHYSMSEKSDMGILLLPYTISSTEIESLFPDNVRIRVYKKQGIDKRLFETASENARRKLADYANKPYYPPGLIEITEILKLKDIPEYIGGVDISHFSGKWTAGAVVCFKNGKPFKSAYRFYKLENIGNDDYKSINHILKRYIEKYRLDMIIIDGGKGQLDAARKAVEALDYKTHLYALVKRPDTLLDSEGMAVSLNQRGGAMKLIREIRDEAHRFANKLRKIRMEKHN